MAPRQELSVFAAVLAVLLAGFFGESLFGGKVLSPADVLFVSASFRDAARGPNVEPGNRLLIDPVLQFQPWLEFNRAQLRRGRLPVWNGLAGCGAPHLANGQSAVFDPFHLIAYLGTLPEAHSWMAAARLWVAGIGIFLLSRSWGLGPWGRWFAGLAFPFCGFLVVWLLFPVTSVAVWMPWLLWASDRTLERPGARNVGVLALIAGCVLLGGHVQTSAHVLLAAGISTVWRASREPITRIGLSAWTLGIVLGIGIAAVTILPLARYLTRSPVWEDRTRALRPVGELAGPRVLDAARLALPYAFGSQRQRHPNLAKALGVQNLNESAGGFAGLATLVWLAPLGWSLRRREPRVALLAGLVVVGILGAFGVPPVENLLRAVPVLNVTDNRRLTLWVAFGLVMLGGFGLDHLAETRGGQARVAIALAVAAGLLLLVTAASVGRFQPFLLARAEAHYKQAAIDTPGADPAVYHERGMRQVRQTLAFYPRYLTVAGCHLLLLAALAEAVGRESRAPRIVRPVLFGLTLLDLIGFGYGLNPAIAPGEDRPESAVIAYLRHEVGTSGRVLGVGEELPPNTLMRYGLNDIRNYDSVELARSLDWFAPLYEPGASSRTSRRTISWSGVIRSLDRLRAASVRAVVAATPPPAGVFRRVDRVGAVWIARLDGAPRIEAERSGLSLTFTIDQDEIHVDLKCQTMNGICLNKEKIIVRETFDPGWKAEMDGLVVPVEPYLGSFLAVSATPGARRLVLRYDPGEIRLGRAVSLASLVFTVFALTGFRPFRSTRILVQGLGRTRAIELESVL
jgi:hypothetical protein